MALSVIQELNPRHHKILDYCIAGLTNKQIAEKLNMSDRQVCIIIKAQSFQHELAIRRSAFQQDLDEKLATQEDEAANHLKQNAFKAAKVLSGCLNSPSDHIKLRSAESILDRTGHQKATPQKQQDDKTIINISRDDLLLLQETLEMEDKIVNRKHKVENTIIDTKEGGDKKLVLGGSSIRHNPPPSLFLQKEDSFISKLTA